MFRLFIGNTQSRTMKFRRWQRLSIHSAVKLSFILLELNCLSCLINETQFNTKRFGKDSSVMINRKIAYFIDVDVEIWLFLILVGFSLSFLTIVFLLFLRFVYCCACSYIEWVSFLLFLVMLQKRRNISRVLCGINFFCSVSIISFFSFLHIIEEVMMILLKFCIEKKPSV